ncbi:hypothetical protein AHAS_Ahas19G0335600 [Arachis hypogaea]
MDPQKHGLLEFSAEKEGIVGERCEASFGRPARRRRCTAEENAGLNGVEAYIEIWLSRGSNKGRKWTTLGNEIHRYALSVSTRFLPSDNAGGGVDHHMRTVVFGCAILSNESEGSYVWLLRAFLEAMKGKQPKFVIMDGNLAMKSGLPSTLTPSSRAVASVSFWFTGEDCKDADLCLFLAVPIRGE